MVSAGVGIAVGDELEICLRADANEGERRNGRHGFLGEIVSEEEAAERNRLGAGVVKFEPIGAVRIVGHPFVHTEVADAPKPGGGVERAGGGCVESPRAGAVGNAANRKVGGLESKADGINQGAAASGAVKEID